MALPAPVLRYEFDEPAAGSLLTIADSGPSGRHLVAASISASAKFTSLRRAPSSPLHFARVAAGNSYHVAGSPGADQAAVIGDCTFMVWARIDQTGVLHIIGGYAGGNPESTATNILAQLRITAALYMEWLHETTSAGSNIQVTQTAGLPLTLGQVHHLAWRINRTAKTVEFFLDGAKQDTKAYATNPTGGTSAVWHVHTDVTNTAGTYLIGAWRSLIAVSGLVSDAAIALAAADNTMTHDAATAGVIVCWNNIDQPDAIETVRGYHLHAANASIVHGIPGLIPDGGLAKFFTGGTNGYLTAAPVPDANAVAVQAVFLGSFTVSYRGRFGDQNSLPRGDWIFGDPGPEDSPNNFIGADFVMSPSRGVRVFSEWGPGTDEIGTSLGAVYTSDEAYGTWVWTYRIQVSELTYAFYVFRDKTLVHSGGGFRLSDASKSVLRIGHGPSELAAFGAKDGFTVWDVALTDAEIGELVDEMSTGGVGGGGGDAAIVITTVAIGSGQGGLGFEVD